MNLRDLCLRDIFYHRETKGTREARSRPTESKGSLCPDSYRDVVAFVTKIGHKAHKGYTKFTKSRNIALVIIHLADHSLHFIS